MRPLEAEVGLRVIGMKGLRQGADEGGRVAWFSMRTPMGWDAAALTRRRDFEGRHFRCIKERRADRWARSGGLTGSRRRKILHGDAPRGG
jgi:hypothetical protein